MAASSAAFKSFRSAGVVVFANARTDRGKLPRGASEMLASPEAGRTIPIVVATTADGETGLGAVSYKSLSDDPRKAARTLRKNMEGKDVVGNGNNDEPADKENEDDEAPLTKADSGFEVLIEEQEWTNASGKTIRAAVLAVEFDTVTFLLSNKKTVEYPLSKLSEESREAITEATEDE